MQIEARGVIYDATSAPPEERIAYFTSLCPLGAWKVESGGGSGQTADGSGQTAVGSRQEVVGSKGPPLPATGSWIPGPPEGEGGAVGNQDGGGLAGEPSPPQPPSPDAAGEGGVSAPWPPILGGSAPGTTGAEDLSPPVPLSGLGEGGVWLAGFQVGESKHGPKGTVGLCRSRDGGETWERIPWRFETVLDGVPGSLAMGEMVEVEPGRVLLFATWFDRSEPERPLFDPVTEGLLRSRQLLAESTDEGETWSAWRTLDTGGLTGCAGTGPVVRWADGTIAVPFESFKEFDDLSPARHAAWVLVSRDGGATFEAPLRVAQHPEHRLYYWDQRLCVAGDDGEFVALIWTHDLAEKQDRNVHFVRTSLAELAAGTAPLPRETSIPGQIAAPLLLPDGRLLGFVVDRGNPGTLRLWVSEDGGETWPEEKALTVHTHDERALLSQGQTEIDFKQYWEDMGKWSFGHPAIRPLADGKVLVAYYAGSPDCMSVHWARLKDEG